MVIINSLTLKLLIKDIPQLSHIPLSEINFHKLSGLTNTNYLLETKDKKYVLKIPRELTSKNISRQYEAHNTDIVYQLGLTPETLWREKQGENLTGMSLVVAIENPQTLKPSSWEDSNIVSNVAASLKTLQASKQIFKGKLDHNDIAKYLNQYFNLCSKQQQEELQAERQQALDLLEKIKRCDRQAVPSHIDLVAENILQDENKLWLIDWEYSAMASPFWDIATVCNEAKFNDDASKSFLNKVLEDTNEEDDVKCLQTYQSLVKTVSHFWYAAYIS